MELYDGIIEKLYQLLAPHSADCTARNVDADCFSWDSREKQVILKTDAAIELGGGSLPAVSGTLCTCSEKLMGEGPAAEGERRVALYGPNLSELQGDRAYARVTLIKLRESFAVEEYKQYNLLRSIEYIRYHVNPQGYMPRISTARNREQVRIAREAVRRGLDFYKAGRSYADAYLGHPAVEAAETIFITLERFDYKALQTLLDRAEEITMSLEHPLNNLKMDCNSCNLKPVCDEVEALCSGGKR